MSLKVITDKIECKKSTRTNNSIKSTISYLKQKVEEMKKSNASTKILLYMVIHDLKHPADSLIYTIGQM